VKWLVRTSTAGPPNQNGTLPTCIAATAAGAAVPTRPVCPPPLGPGLGARLAGRAVAIRHRVENTSYSSTSISLI